METSLMNLSEHDYWWDMQFYRGLLPVKDAIAARSYVILALESSTPSSVSHETSFEKDSADAFSQIYSNRQDICPPDSESVVSMKAKPSTQAVAFFMYKKQDVLPPPLLHTWSSKKLSRCFVLCPRKDCGCKQAHVLQDSWRLRVDTVSRISLTVSERGRIFRLSHTDIIPTAGYFFALGLLKVQAVQAVVPTFCRFNLTCKHRCYCLYIHANIGPTWHIVLHSSTSLKKSLEPNALDFLSIPQQNKFFDFLSDKGIATVGDLQNLGDSAFECLLANTPPCWAEAILITSQIRSFGTKALIQDVLATFPHIKSPIQLPANLETVADLLRMPSSTFYKLNWQPYVLNACEIVRNRFDLGERHKVIRLSKEPENSFFVKITKIITDFRFNHAHCSWRKHNPNRTVVTSLITYVDVRDCECCLSASTTFAQNSGSARSDAGDLGFVYEINMLPPIDPDKEIGFPEHSWCSCPRRWEIAVNYELSTPSGSRCSEQNAMGKLACLGVPTWSIRELFVHGANSENVNPLFPCGVCDNMLQKVAKDVRTRCGGEIRLFMYDATAPRKVVHLPLSEISNRAGSSFKRFVENDLQY